jgi:hypothetical protein
VKGFYEPFLNKVDEAKATMWQFEVGMNRQSNPMKTLGKF